MTATSIYTRTASLTDVGCVRSVNQDWCGEFVRDEGYRLLIVADGMGGHQGGEIASQTTVGVVGEVFQRGVDDPAALLREAFVSANARVHEMAEGEAELHGMGTTGVALLIGPARKAWVANVGDSRVYRSRAGKLETLTDDHSWVNEEVHQNRLTPEEAANHPRKNVLTRSIGVERTVEVDVVETDVKPGDRFLLCSDGLWGEVPEDQIADVLATQPPERAVQALVELARQNGAPDNVTVQIAVVPSRLDAAGGPEEDLEATLDGPPSETTLPLGAPEPETEARSARAAPGERPRLLIGALAAVAALLGAALLWLALEARGVRSEPQPPAPPEQERP